MVLYGYNLIKLEANSLSYRKDYIMDVQVTFNIKGVDKDVARFMLANAIASDLRARGFGISDQDVEVSA